MKRSGLDPLTIIVGVALLVSGAMLVLGQVYDHGSIFGEQASDSQNSSTINICENDVKSYCRYNPKQDWSDVYEDCTQYKDIIDEDGDTICPKDVGDTGGYTQENVPDDSTPVSDDASSSDDSRTCEERSGTCKDGDRSYYDLLYGDTADTEDCENFCYIPRSNVCYDRGGTCKDTGILDASTMRNMEDPEQQIDESLCGESQYCFFQPESQCKAMGGSCKVDDKDKWSDIGTVRQADCDGFCYIPAGTECERKYKGVCKSDAERSRFEDRDGQIVDSDCEGFCYVSPEDIDGTCEAPDNNNHCTNAEYGQFCSGRLDNRGDQDGCLDETDEDGNEIEMACCRQVEVTQEETPTEGVLDIYFIPASSTMPTTTFNNRVDAYTRGMRERTPLGTCWDESVNVQAFEPGEEYTNVPDVKVTVHQSERYANDDPNDDRIITGEAKYHGNIHLYGGVSGVERDVTAAHELSHVFGVCDEYDKGAYNSLFHDSNSCHNAWPTDRARTPTHDCTEMGGGGNTDATCGTDLDGQLSSNPQDDPASVMGTFGAVDTTSMFNTYTIPLTGLPPAHAQGFLADLEAYYGVTCK